ncbi:MAG: signal peptidase II [Candidatus Eremiobacteraeota bacterium]|nr:signal peptidase II [Candidatus Eremiobacteraeota bacterium]MBV9648165.1 signal peptidase II [Candidatus Eremiobacteraeota bacterium]
MLRSLSFWLTAVLVVVADQYTKHVVSTDFLPGESRIVVRHALWLTYVQNVHGAFGLFGSRPWLLIAMALVVLAVFWLSFRESALQSRLVRIAFGAIVGGAVGNILDRFHYQYVIDFIDLRWWPVFNVADSCITIGVCLLVLTTLLRERAVARAKSSPGPTS